MDMLEDFSITFNQRVIDSLPIYQTFPKFAEQVELIERYFFSYFLIALQEDNLDE